MLNPDDRRFVSGPLLKPAQPGRCARCETDVYYECADCKAIYEGRAPGEGDACQNCGSTDWCGPCCKCSVCDCGED